MPAIAAAANKPMPALFALAMAPDRERSAEPDRDNAGGAAIVAATLLSPTDAAALVAQPGEAQRQALDMGRQDWPQKMIDRIEALRDDANANDTSIRLKPEALGQVDVALRTHADGAVSVHFTAEQPATRTLIADAAPQLNAAAEARGIRLAGTSVDLSGSGMADGNRPRPQFAAPQNKTNPVSAARGDDIQAVADGRIA
jgi:flagellar hook-length control protein FliK